MTTDDLPSRRPLKVREARWAQATAAWLARRGIRPNVISVLSGVSALLAACAIYAGGRAESEWLRAVWLLTAAVGMQLRLLCNLFDGMVAIEGGYRTKSGEVFNELPDRFSDAFLLIGAGHFQSDGSLVEWGWLAAVLAVVTAYIRALGAAAGAGQDFRGPMAKPQRMAVMTVACLVEALAGLVHVAGTMKIALGLVIAGCLITIVRRTRHLVRTLEQT